MFGAGKAAERQKKPHRALNPVYEARECAKLRPSLTHIVCVTCSHNLFPQSLRLLYHPPWDRAAISTGFLYRFQRLPTRLIIPYHHLRLPSLPTQTFRCLTHQVHHVLPPSPSASQFFFAFTRISQAHISAFLPSPPSNLHDRNMSSSPLALPKILQRIISLLIALPHFDLCFFTSLPSFSFHLRELSLIAPIPLRTQLSDCVSYTFQEALDCILRPIPEYEGSAPSTAAWESCFDPASPLTNYSSRLRSIAGFVRIWCV